MTMTAKRFFICNQADTVLNKNLVKSVPLLWRAQSKLFAAFGNRYRNCKRDTVVSSQNSATNGWNVNNNGRTNNNNKNNNNFVAPVLDI